MRILIVGDGDTASHLARQLSMENLDVTLLGRDRPRLTEIDSRYNVMAICGDPTSPAALKEAGAANADLLVAVTPDQNDNILACLIGKTLGSRKTVARILNFEYLESCNREMFRRFGVDTLVYPEFLVAREIESGLVHNNFRTWQSICNGALVEASVRIRPHDAVDGMSLIEFGSKYRNLRVAAIKRRRGLIVPRGTDVIQAGDIVYFSILGGSEVELEQVCGRPRLKINDVMIAGAGKITYRLVHLLKDYNVTVIDPDRELCDRVRRYDSDITVVCADPRDLSVLEEEGIENVDAFLSLDESSEQNIVACMIAREMGVPFTLADIEDIQYFSEAETLDIDMFVNKKLSTSSAILEMLLDTGHSASRCMAIEDAEFAELDVHQGAKITKAPVAKLSLSRDMTLVGLIRDGKGYLVDGRTHIQPGDRVVVFCLSGLLPRLRSMFG